MMLSVHTLIAIFPLRIVKKHLLHSTIHKANVAEKGSCSRTFLQCFLLQLQFHFFHSHKEKELFLNAINKRSKFLVFPSAQEISSFYVDYKTISCFFDFEAISLNQLLTTAEAVNQQLINKVL